MTRGGTPGAMLLLGLFAVWSFLTAAVGAVAGLVLGNLRLPVALLISDRAGPVAAANLVISAVTALSSTVEHLRQGRVVRRLFVLIAVPSSVGAVVGGLLAGLLDERLVLSVVAAVLLVEGVRLLRKGRAQVARRGQEDEHDADDTGGEDPAARRRQRLAVLGGGFVVGVVGGIVGLVLNALRAPLLLRFADDDATRVAATNVAAGFFVALFGVVGHVPGGLPDLRLTIAGCIGAVPGGVLGARLTGRLAQDRLTEVIGAVLVLAAVSTAAQAALGSSGG